MLAHVRWGHLVPGSARIAAVTAMIGIGHGAASPDPSPSAR